MATVIGALRTETSISKRMVMGAAMLLGLVGLSGWLFSLNYWLGLTFFFATLFIFIQRGLTESQPRGLWLLLTVSLFVALLTGKLALDWLANQPNLPQLAQSSPIANFLLGSDQAVLVTAILLGLLTALVMVVLPLFLLTALATAGVLKWHHKDEQLSFGAVWWYLLTALLGIFHFAVMVDGLELKGRDKDKERLDNFGGPGWLKVYPGQVVVLHRWGRITRSVGLGSTMLKSEEQIKAILPLTPTGESYTLENVLTRDRVPLRITVAYEVQVASAAESKNRLNEQAGDKLIGDDYEQCYESIARLIAAKSPDVWGSMKGAITKAMREVLSSYSFDELYSPGKGDKPWEVSLNKRRLTEIKKNVLERVKNSGLDKRALLKTVELEVQIPPAVSTRLNEQRAAAFKARLEQHEAAARELAAQVDEQTFASTVKLSQTSAGQVDPTVELARVKAQAEALKAEFNTEYYRHMLQLLQQQNQADEATKSRLSQFASAAPLPEELKRYLSRPNVYPVAPPESRPV